LLERGLRAYPANIDEVILYGSKEDVVSDLLNAKNVWSSSLFPFQIFKQVLKDRPNIVHIQYEFTTFGPFWTNLFVPLAMILIKIAGVKTVLTVHSVIPKDIVDRKLMQQLLPAIAKFDATGYLFRIFLVFLYRTIAISADEIVVHGEWYKKNMILSYKTSAAKIHIIPYGVSDDYNENEVLLEKWRKRIDKHKVILFFGHISPRKDLETLIRSFSIFLENHTYLLVIAGKEPPYYRWFMNKLKSVAMELDISKNVIFTGFITDEEIHILHNSAEFVVFPYLYGFEGPSGPLAFAIQHGVPIIGTNVGHLREEIIHMREGILVPPGDVQELAEAMKTLASSKNLRREFSERLRAKKREMLWKVVGFKTFQVYKRAMGLQRGKALQKSSF
jgi:glycosyltransferase involved in cell wall biosynthesis